MMSGQAWLMVSLYRELMCFIVRHTHHVREFHAGPYLPLDSHDPFPFVAGVLLSLQLSTQRVKYRANSLAPCSTVTKMSASSSFEGGNELVSQEQTSFFLLIFNASFSAFVEVLVLCPRFPFYLCVFARLSWPQVSS